MGPDLTIAHSSFQVTGTLHVVVAEILVINIEERTILIRFVMNNMINVR